jgi:hypothetical protein
MKIEGSGSGSTPKCHGSATLVASPGIFRGGPARRGRRNQKERLAVMMGQSWLNHGPQQPDGRYHRFLVDCVDSSAWTPH